MSYIIILSQLKLQENVASVIKYRSVQLKAAGEIKGLEGSDILVKVINKRICSNLKGLILRNTTKHGDKLTQTYLSVVEFLLENKLFTDEETLKIFGEERALDILVNHIAGVFHLSQDINALVLSVDLLDFLIKDDHTRNLTFILQSKYKSIGFVAYNALTMNS
ncbi:hypothetical protein BY996DRAFT_1334320 [Phakopsora pachyrhizi]|nr:hypothetical protein BY996DRAFT_1334320 [Phakopsora pachyrhizi]